MMHVAIWVGISLEGARGVPLFHGHLARHLAQLDDRNRYSLFAYWFRDFERKKKLIYLPPQPNFKLDVHRWPESVVNPLIYRWDLPVFWPSLRAAGVTLFHATAPPTPRLWGMKVVTTVHDFAPLLFPQWSGASAPVRHDRRWLMRADRLLCVSHNTLKDMLRLFDIPAEKAVVIPPGVDTEMFHPREPGGDPRRLRRRYGLPERYLFCVGPYDQRRNYKALIPILSELAATPEGKDLGLVIAGALGGNHEEIAGMARAAGLQDRVRLIGYVPGEDLPGLYQEAEVFVYPSLYEGFGHPPLEALACGAPVVCSDAAALPETVGGCAALAPPCDTPGFVKAILELLHNPGLRRTRREAGLKHAASLTWRRMIERTLAVYEELHARP